MIVRDEHLKDSNGLFDCTSTGWEFYIGRGGFIRATMQNRWQGCVDGTVVKCRDADMASELERADVEDLRALSNSLSEGLDGCNKIGDTFRALGVTWTLVKHGHKVQ